MDIMDGDASGFAPGPRHVLSLDGGTDPHYDLWCYTSPLGVRIQCIVISPVDDRFLLAFPHQVWHRQVARRVLPQQLLGKPTLVEVAVSPEDDRETVDDAVSMKLWVGYVGAIVYDSLEIVDVETAMDYRFKSDESGGWVPYAESLVEVLKEHFEFLSAESGVPPLVEGVGSEDLSSRVTSLEAALGKMAQNLDIVLEKVTEQKRGDGRVKFTEPLVTEPRRARKDARSEKFPTLDAAVVSAALAAGVSEENLVEMQKMMGAAEGASKRLREPALRSSGARAKPASREPLSESEDEVEEVGEPGSALDSSANPMESALTKLTELVSLLAADRVKKAKSSKVELALDGLVSGSGGDTSGTAVGKRAAAARRALRTALVDAPEEIYMVVERLLLEDLTSRTIAHGMPKADLNARAWIEHRSRIGAYKTSAHCAWGVGGILDDLIQGRTAHARARAALLLLQLDQCAVDKGDWTLASELSLEQGPPPVKSGDPLAATSERGRKPILEVARQSLVGGYAFALERCRGLCAEEEVLGQEATRGGGQFGNSQSQAESKSKREGDRQQRTAQMHERNAYRGNCQSLRCSG